MTAFAAAVGDTSLWSRNRYSRRGVASIVLDSVISSEGIRIPESFPNPEMDPSPDILNSIILPYGASQDGSAEASVNAEADVP